jgi:capsular polysaccharide biosynthesis protein
MTRQWVLSRAPLRSSVQARTARVLDRVGPKPLSPRTGGRVAGAVESLREWAADTPGATYEALRGAERYERRPPKTLTPEWQTRFEPLLWHHSPEAFRAVVPHARLVGSDPALVLTSDRRLLAESAYEHLRISPPRLRLHRPRHLRGRYMALINQWWRNHFHWLVDTVPRANLLPLDEDAETPVIVPAGLSHTQVESLAMVGVPPERLRAFDHPHLQVDELIFPSFVGRPGYLPRWAAVSLRERLSPESSPREPRRRLWVSRAAATRRRLVNEGAVVEVLDSYGFEPIQPEEHSLAEQLDMFRSADMIVAPHGSGLANIVAARDATVIELQSKRWWGNGCYYALAEALGLDYWFVVCDETRRGHLLVDPALLQATIDAAFDEAGDRPPRGR